MPCLSRGWRPALVVSILAIALAGCEPVTAPRPVDGTFVLRTVGVSPIPAITGTALDTQFWVLADTIVLRRDGSGEWRSTTSRLNLTTLARDTTQTVKRFDHRRQGQIVRATGITCEPLCEVLPDEASFVVEPEWLTFGAGTAAQRYERVAASDAF